MESKSASHSHISSPGTASHWTVRTDNALSIWIWILGSWLGAFAFAFPLSSRQFSGVNIFRHPTQLSSAFPTCNVFDFHPIVYLIACTSTPIPFYYLESSSCISWIAIDYNYLINCYNSMIPLNSNSLALHDLSHWVSYIVVPTYLLTLPRPYLISVATSCFQGYSIKNAERTRRRVWEDHQRWYVLR